MTTPDTHATPATDRERFADLLPFYVNGTLGADDRVWVDDYLKSHPAAQAELSFFQTLQSDVQELAPKVPSTIGLATTLKLIQNDRPTLAERIQGFFGSLGVRPTIGLAFGVMALQAALIVGLLGRGPEDDVGTLRTAPTVPVTDGPLIKVNFAPDTPEADIRMALVAVQGSLAGGPGQLGDYYVRVPASQARAALATLQAQRGVQAASLVPGLPARP